MTGIFEGTRLGRSRRLIVKVGSTLLVDHDTRTIRRDWLMGLAGELAALRGIGCDVLVVSSGAIALGRRILGLNSGQLRLEESQAAASAGQIALAGSWAEVLGQHGLVAGQILLTLNDTEERRRYLNARATLNMLLKRGAVPVINENDTVATSEIRYGDNDRLAARVASMISADCLVLLSDVEGLFSAPPGSGSETFIDSVEQVTAEIEAMAGRPASGMGSGGMVTKLEAARIATAAGCGMVIALGRRDNPLSAIATGQRCTWFRAEANPAAARKRWIAGTLVPTGRLIIDAGAARALESGKSLLPAGVSAIHGQFARGDAVSIVTAEGKEIARGLVAYDCADAARIAGRRSAQIEEALGFRGRDEMVHRDDLVLTGS